MRLHKCILLLLSIVFTGGNILAQQAAEPYPAKWRYNLKRTRAKEYQLVFHLELKRGWHVRAHNDNHDTLMMVPEFLFTPSSEVQLQGEIKPEGILETVKVDSVGLMDVYSYKVLYIQQLSAKAGTKVSGKYRYQVCDKQHCLPVRTEKFAFIMKE